MTPCQSRKEVPAITQVCYRYDGSFGGFLTCIFDVYAHREPPAEFLTRADETVTLWPERPVETDRSHAMRVHRALREKVSPEFQRLVERGFLTCLPRRELDLCTLIRRGFSEGDRVRMDLADPTVARVMLALRKLDTEVDHLKGFIRFSELDGVLAGEIEPKNRVLPLLADHFAARLSGEKLALYDRTHGEAFFYADGKRAILPVENFRLGPAGGVELGWRALWRSFYRTISIEGRYNPRCRMTHMPKRYWGTMTEFQTEEERKELP